MKRDSVCVCVRESEQNGVKYMTQMMTQRERLAHKNSATLLIRKGIEGNFYTFLVALCALLAFTSN